jgi:Tfp pilus assembly PilM family ATPase
MDILSGVSEFFGLDIGTASIRVVQLRGAPPIKTLDRYGSAPVAGNIALSDSKADTPKLAQAIVQLCKQAGITTKNVAVGIPSSKVYGKTVAGRVSQDYSLSGGFLYTDTFGRIQNRLGAAW